MLNLMTQNPPDLMTQNPPDLMTQNADKKTLWSDYIFGTTSKRNRKFAALYIRRLHTYIHAVKL